MNILFYSPLQGRSKDTESIMEAFVKNGEDVYLLTQRESEVYHDVCEKFGVKCYSTSPVEGIDTLYKKVRQIIFFITFCRQMKIDVVYSQLEPANLIAVIGQFFVMSKVVLVRHHVDIMETDSTRLAHMLSILSYKLAKNVVVVSGKAKEYMINRERIRAGKIRKINLGYNFALWPPIDYSMISSRRAAIDADFVLVTAARLVKSKRVDMCIQITKVLRDSGIDCCLMILGVGEEMVPLKGIANELGIEKHVFFEGYVDNVRDFVAVADMMIHLSATESSATVVKEAGLAKKPVLVCRDVGDFCDYIEDGVSGFLVSRDSPFEDALLKIHYFLNNRGEFDQMGDNLHDSVLRHFSIDVVYPEYEKLNREVA